MVKLPFTSKEITDNFSETALALGKKYQSEGRVKELFISPGGGHIRAAVQGDQEILFDAVITVEQDNDGLWIDGTCSCPSSFNCEHVVSALWEALTRSKLPEHEQQLDSVNKTLLREEERLIYILFQKTFEGNLVLYVEPCLVRLIKSGSYGKPKPLPLTPTEQANFFLAVDIQLLHWLEFARKQYPPTLPPQIYPLTGHNGVELLKQLVESGRCHWGMPNNPPLKLGEQRKAHLEWKMEPGGLQRLSCHVGGGEVHTVVPLTPPWYIDHTSHVCGPLETGLNPEIAAVLIAAPPLRPEQIRKLTTDLHDRLTTAALPLPKKFKHEKVEEYDPLPRLRLIYPAILMKPDVNSSWRTFEVKLPLAELSFGYGKTIVRWGDPSETLNAVDKDTLIHIPRNLELENQAVKILNSLQMTPLMQLEKLDVKDSPYQHCWLIAEDEDQKKLLDFTLNELPKLRQAGWTVETDPLYPLCVIDEESTEWYSEIDDFPGRGWFNLELGISVEGKRYNLLPLLLKFIEKFSGGIDIPAGEKILVPLPDGRYLPMPVERVRTILNVLSELYDPDSLNSAHKLSLSRWRAQEMLTLEKAFDSKRFHWLGAENLKKMGERLQSFSGIKNVVIPPGFHTELRHYQQEGLNWLQFLREYDLGGVLADDMGLGKTVQALAHLWVEKNSGRMDRPCLVIAPTSLMTNWRMEAKRFVPDLKILTLHGATRHSHFASMNEYDVILSTYPLLIRDKEELLKQKYHLLILDEAQMIKNPQSKASIVVRQMEARHRVCLTGTPMENHLGELWSLFHFLLPGLLGDYKQFKRIFRIPIEKGQDKARVEILAKRVAPFLLRRTKKKVAQELPEKTEIIRAVELMGAQRDLYESVRIAMHQRITEAVQNKGLGSSQIVILDALLKLRQICCDPRLLKLKSVTNTPADSAKLELLMEMLPNLMEEGRHVLLFSQFTSMLELIEKECVHHRLNYVKLTGQTKDRATPIEQFQSGQVPLFLISLKAGGVGLNLTAADTVIHYDPWWNPAVEDQATDRAHRIGQDKAVFVYKLIAAGTLEEKIIELQKHKSALVEGLLSTEGTNTSGVTLDDLQVLFSPL